MFLVSPCEVYARFLLFFSLHFCVPSIFVQSRVFVRFVFLRRLWLGPTATVVHRVSTSGMDLVKGGCSLEFIFVFTAPVWDWFSPIDFVLAETQKKYFSDGRGVALGVGCS